jgi:predicted ATPase
MPSNALDYITIKGFKSIASIEKLKLGPINVLIGANGSGKSNFLDAFRLLQHIGEGRLSNYVGTAGGAEKILHFGSKTTPVLTIHLSFLGNGSSYDAELMPTGDDGLYKSSQGVGGSRGPLDTSRKDAALTAVDHWTRNAFAGWRVYHLHDTSRMRITASVPDNRFLRDNGSNLAALLYYLREKHSDSYNLIRGTVQSAAPFFDDFRLEPEKLNPDTIRLEWKHRISDQYFGASSLSDGTLRFVALAVLFLQPVDHRPPVILVDEPELGLHPYAIGLLASLIRHASVDNQVIVSTQSSSLVDYFQPDEVLVADRVDRGTQITHLDSARLDKWLEDYSLGQLWEKSELGGCPVRS